VVWLDFEILAKSISSFVFEEEAKDSLTDQALGSVPISFHKGNEMKREHVHTTPIFVYGRE
jgi:hypothetical protein